MARPKLGDSDTERLHIKITADEIKAIEDWRYANRVPSKSEAVRRLCAVALVALNGLDKLKRMAEYAAASALDDYEHIGGHFRGFLDDAVKGKEHGFSYSEAKDLLHDYSDRAYWHEQNARYLNRIIAGLSDALDTYSDPQTFADAEQKADEKLTELNAFVDYQHHTWDVMGASHARSAIIRSLTDDESAHLNSMDDREDRIEYLDKKVAKYQASRERRRKRLIAKIRKEDERIRQGILARLQNDDGENSEEEE